MRKRHRNHEEANHERWLISYADFITLLFAFFVVMFASSQADRNKAKRVSEAVEQAFDGKKKTHSTDGAGLGVGVGTGAVQELEPSLKRLAKELEEEIRAGKMQVHMEARGIVVSLSEATFFPSGEDAIDSAGFGSLEKVGQAIEAVPNSVRAEGHTDSIPIHTERFRSNWDLSAARAIAVMNFLRDRCEIRANRIAITGYADTFPLEPNDTAAGRAKNRRVDIVILNSGAAQMEPTSRK